MKWPHIPIKRVCIPTAMRDPREKPDEVFSYVDISSIDRTRKIISQISNIQGSEAPSRARKEIKTGDVLVSTVRPNLNAVAIVPQELNYQVASTGFCVLRSISNRIINKYLYYYTLTSIFIEILGAKVRGAHYPAVSDSDVKEIEIPLPSLSEQRRIVEILDEAFTIRNKRTEAYIKAERVLPALFYNMFGDPIKNSKKWKTERLGKVCAINPSLDITKLNDDTLVSFVPMADVDEKWGMIIGNQRKPFQEVKRGFTPFQDGDVIFAKITPCMENGKAAIAIKLQNGIGYGSTEFHVFRPSAEVTSEWIFSLLRLEVFRAHAKGSFTGTVGQQRVPSDFLANYKVPIPSLALQNIFSASLKTFYEWVVNSNKTISKVEILFEVLLHRAFSGDLTAKWREDHMKELLAEMEEQAKYLSVEASA